MAGRTDHMIAMAVLKGGGVSEGGTHMARMFEELASALEARRERIAEEGHAMPGVREALEAVARLPATTQSLLTGNIEANAALKLAAFGLDRLVDLEIGGYGSDPHGARSDLVRIAREKAARLRGVHVEAHETVLIGDTPLDVKAAHEAGARAVAVATGPYTVLCTRNGTGVPSGVPAGVLALAITVKAPDRCTLAGIAMVVRACAGNSRTTLVVVTPGAPRGASRIVTSTMKGLSLKTVRTNGASAEARLYVPLAGVRMPTVALRPATARTASRTAA